MTNRGICGPVLIADDDAAMRALLEESLEAAGYDTLAAASGDAAIELADEQRLCAAVVDVNLPVRSGYEVCRALRQAYGPLLPVVFVSGARTESYDRVAGLLFGADDYVVKPFEPQELVARVDGLVKRAKTAESRSLTPREHEVLTLLATGLTQLQIALELDISPKTVATHIDRVLGKLGVQSRAQAVAFAYRETLVAV